MMVSQMVLTLKADLFMAFLDQIHVGKSAKISRATSIDVDAVPNECPEDARTW